MKTFLASDERKGDEMVESFSPTERLIRDTEDPTSNSHELCYDSLVPTIVRDLCLGVRTIFYPANTFPALVRWPTKNRKIPRVPLAVPVLIHSSNDYA